MLDVSGAHLGIVTVRHSSRPIEVRVQDIRRHMRSRCLLIASHWKTTTQKTHTHLTFEAKDKTYKTNSHTQHQQPLPQHSKAPPTNKLYNQDQHPHTHIAYKAQTTSTPHVRIQRKYRYIHTSFTFKANIRAKITCQQSTCPICWTQRCFAS